MFSDAWATGSGVVAAPLHGDVALEIEDLHLLEAAVRLFVRDELVAGHFEAGTMLREVEFAKRFGVSRGLPGHLIQPDAVLIVQGNVDKQLVLVAACNHLSLQIVVSTNTKQMHLHVGTHVEGSVQLCFHSDSGQSKAMCSVHICLL